MPTQQQDLVHVPTLKENLMRVQADNGWTIEEMAEKLRISRQYWSQIRRGYRRLPTALLPKIAQAFPHLRPQTIAVMDGKEAAE